MIRTFDPSTLVVLPRLSAATADGLADKLRTAAQGVERTPAIEQALTRLVACHEVLQKEIRDKLRGPKAKAATREADTALDAVYSAIFDWCRAYSKLPDSLAPGLASKVNVIVSTLFPDGLKFTKQTYRLQWSDSKARVETIQERGLDRVFEELGGMVFVTALREAHDRYGKALGMTQEVQAKEPAEIRMALSQLETALRGYVLQVTASVDIGAEREAEAAAKLLQPLMEWPSKLGVGVVPSGDVEESMEEVGSG